ncbi:undecaprenyl diphosphate synthase family protein [Halalkalicoccus subterraneus]|uniref:undecaprenyl diphosphate synthase family protein n=1 Tax=Halalkalicoccus subterraneus TaxID=2675002 RepID=UPI000EFD79A8|nr:undecaprenyl diphosphate synthase family protein [Halalkalicoccus subterraneus]
MGLYDRYLAARVERHDGTSPSHVAIVLTERDLLERGAYATLEDVLEWAFEFGADRVTVYVSVLDPAAAPTLGGELAEIDAPRPVAVRGPEDTKRVDTPISIGIGLGGKREFARAVRGLAREVERGERDPDGIRDEDIESQLVFPNEPDLLIKTGAERLSDFMIWQSVYAELYFTDVNWRDFRKRDYLRAVLDYKKRSRRFGR